MSEIEEIGKKLKSEPLSIDFSSTLVERISSSGDVTGTPFYHWRWKRKFLADMVAWPKSTEDVAKIIQIANKHKIPITPRGAGSSYYGEGSPADGGIVLDMKKFKTLEKPDEEGMCWLSTGYCFKELNNELNELGYELCNFPTSAPSSIVGGWIGIGGKMGVGTVKYGGFSELITEAKVVTALGEIQHLKEKKDIALYFGTCGIFGIVTEIKLKVVKKSLSEIPIVFGFSTLEDLINASQEIIKDTDPFHLRFSDQRHEIRTSGIQSWPNVLFIIYRGDTEEVKILIEKSKEISSKNDGTNLGAMYAEQSLRDYLIYEMKVKLETPVLMLQQYLLPTDKIQPFLQKFGEICDTRKLNHCYYGLFNKENQVRLCLYTPTDNDYWGHFLSSKACLHQLVEECYQIGGSIYSYGLQNSIYMIKYEEERKNRLIELKAKLDPNGIMNPLKMIECKMKYSRINSMFKMTNYWRKLGVKINTANVILGIEIPHLHDSKGE